MTIWRTTILCCIPKSANAHSEYVAFIAFLLQQRLHEHASVLPYTYIALKYWSTALLKSRFSENRCFNLLRFISCWSYIIDGYVWLTPIRYRIWGSVELHCFCLVSSHGVHIYNLAFKATAKSQCTFSLPYCVFIFVPAIKQFYPKFIPRHLHINPTTYVQIRT
jgi:hypothetical protein